MTTKTALIDYEMGNLLSVSKALEAVGAAVRIVRSPDEVRADDALVLPGVGNFGDGMTHLRSSGFAEFLPGWIREHKPFLGICLGMQMLMETSEEAPGVKGLGIFKGAVRKFPSGAGKVPHMGWNTLSVRPECDVLSDLGDTPYFYFVHSYYVAPEDVSIIAAHTRYILDFPSALYSKQLFAAQFHPEKSQENGLSVLRRFVSLAQPITV